MSLFPKPQRGYAPMRQISPGPPVDPPGLPLTPPSLFFMGLFLNHFRVPPWGLFSPKRVPQKGSKMDQKCSPGRKYRLLGFTAARSADIRFS